MLAIHPVANLLPMMTEEEFAGLKADIAANGQREPVWTWQGTIIDGRNRYRACQEIGVEPKLREWDGQGSLVEFVLSLNLHRRHLTSSQRACIAVEALPMLEKEAMERQQRAGKNYHRGQKKKVMELIPEPNATSRDQAARLTKTNERYVSDAKRLTEKAPEIFEKVKQGEMPLPQAKRLLTRKEKLQDLEKKASSVDAEPPDIRHGDCLIELAKIEPGSVRLAFADPPYNQGVNYGDGPKADTLPDADYLSWCKAWMAAVARTLTSDGSFWVLISDEYADRFGCLLREVGLHRKQWLVWYEAFGVNHHQGFGRSSRHLFWCVKDLNRFVFHETAVLRPSDREAKYGDKRAQPGGRTWDSVWGVNPPIPRLVDNAAERLPEFPTQLPLALLRPIVGCASDPGDLVLDPFSGSGTTGAAAIELRRRYVGIERQKRFVDLSNLRLKGVTHGSSSR